MRDYFQDVLPRLGHTAAAVQPRTAGNWWNSAAPSCRTWSSPTSKCPRWTASMRPSRCLPGPAQPPVILVSAYHDAALIERAEMDHIMGYLVKPIKQSDLAPTIAIAVSPFRPISGIAPGSCQPAASVGRPQGDRTGEGDHDEESGPRRGWRISTTSEARFGQEPQTGRNRLDDHDGRRSLRLSLLPEKMAPMTSSPPPFSSEFPAVTRPSPFWRW